MKKYACIDVGGTSIKSLHDTTARAIAMAEARYIFEKFMDSIRLSCQKSSWRPKEKDVGIGYPQLGFSGSVQVRLLLFIVTRFCPER